MLAAAQLLVDTVNVALQPHPLCAHLQLHAVRAARRGEPSSIVGQRDAPDRVREQEFLVTVSTASPFTPIPPLPLPTPRPLLNA